jgi:predicted nucleotidyltransferase
MSRHGAEAAYVFGSVARHEDDGDSDLDLLVRLRPGTTIFDLALMREELEGIAGVPVDVVSEGGLRPRDHHILRDAVPL